MSEVCTDNRFEIIEQARKDIIESTNIETDSDEMKVLDKFLFRCWQMGWLDKYGEAGDPIKQKIKIIDVVLSAPYQIGEYSYVNICKTVRLAIPDDGHDWHVYGESDNEIIEQEDTK